MNNTIIAQSLARIEPGEPAQARILGQILERASANDSRARTRKFVKRLAPIAACIAIAITAVIGYQADWFRGETAADIPGGEAAADSEGKGVFVPAIKLPENRNDAAACVIPLFVYQGRVYVQTLRYGIDEPSAAEDLVGERIGFARGNLNAYGWSKPEDYAEEFAGTVAGDVFTVIGYDPEFRLCMQQTYTDDDGKYFEWVEFYEHLDGIWLEAGSDVFGDRLKLRGNWAQVKFQKFDDWNWGRNIFNDLTGVPESDIDVFIDELYSGTFENIPVESDFFAHRMARIVYFYMDDGSIITVQLIEGGYVQYEHLSWYLVKMPGEAFDKMFAAAE
jgi:hypothetical protein